MGRTPVSCRRYHGARVVRRRARRHLLGGVRQLRQRLHQLQGLRVLSGQLVGRDGESLAHRRDAGRDACIRGFVPQQAGEVHSILALDGPGGRVRQRDRRHELPERREAGGGRQPLRSQITTSRAGNEAITAQPIRQSQPSGRTTGSTHWPARPRKLYRADPPRTLSGGRLAAATVLARRGRVAGAPRQPGGSSAGARGGPTGSPSHAPRGGGGGRGHGPAVRCQDVSYEPAYLRLIVDHQGMFFLSLAQCENFPLFLG